MISLGLFSVIFEERKRATVFSWALSGVSFVSLYAVTPFLVKNAGANAAGLYLTAVSFSGIFQLLDLGVSNYAMRVIAREGDIVDRAANVVHLARGANILASAVMLTIAPVLMIVCLVKAGNGLWSMADVLVVSLCVMGATLGYFLARLNTGILEGLGDVASARLPVLLGMVAVLISQAWVGIWGGGVYLYAICYLMGQLLIYLISLRMLSGRGISIFRCNLRLGEVGKLVKDSHTVGLVSVLGLVQASVMPTIVGVLLKDPSATIIYFYFQRAVSSSSGFSLTPFLNKISSLCRELGTTSDGKLREVMRRALLENRSFFVLSLLVFLVASALPCYRLHVELDSYLLLAAVFSFDLLLNQASSIIFHLRLANLLSAPVIPMLCGFGLGITIGFVGSIIAGVVGFSLGYFIGQSIGFYLPMLSYVLLPSRRN